MKRIMMFVLAGVMLLSACSEISEIEAHEYWARAAMKGNNSAVYMQLHNHTKNDDELLSVSSDAAGAVEIHESKVDANGVMQMNMLPSLPLAATDELEFKPGGMHIMLVNLKEDLNVGDEITVTLHFKNHEDMVLTVPVEDATDMGGSGMDGHNTMP